MNKKLYIGNLPFSADETNLKAHFEGDGRQVISVKIMMDRETGRSRGFAFVEMATPEDAQKAIQALHNKEYMGRPLTVNEAREQAPRTGGFGGGGFNRGPRPNGPGGFGGGGGGFNRDRGPRPGGFGGSAGGGFPPAGAPGFDPPSTGERGRGDRNRGRDKDRDRRKRGGGDDWS